MRCVDRIFVLCFWPPKCVSLHLSATDVRPVDLPIRLSPFLGIDREILLYRRFSHLFVDRWAERPSILAVRELPAG